MFLDGTRAVELHSTNSEGETEVFAVTKGGRRDSEQDTDIVSDDDDGELDSTDFDMIVKMINAAKARTAKVDSDKFVSRSASSSPPSRVKSSPTPRSLAGMPKSSPAPKKKTP